MSIKVIDYHDGETELGSITVAPGTHAATGFVDIQIREHANPDTFFGVVLSRTAALDLAAALARTEATS